MEIAGINIGLGTDEQYYQHPENAERYDDTRRRTAGGERIAAAEQAWINTFLAGEQPEDCTVLDVGGGTGWFSDYLDQQGFDTYCLDPSQAMLQKAEEKDGFHKIRGSAPRLPLADNSVDYAVSIRTAHVIDPNHFADYIREMTRVAEKGVLFDTFRTPSLAHAYHPFLENPSTLYTDDTVEDVVAETGMDVETHEKAFTMPYAGYMIGGWNGRDSNLLELVDASEQLVAETWIEDLFASISVWHLHP